MEKEQSGVQRAGLIYGLNDRPPLKDTLFAAFQHLLAIFVAINTPPLIIAGALKHDLGSSSAVVWGRLAAGFYAFKGLASLSSDRLYRRD